MPNGINNKNMYVSPSGAERGDGEIRSRDEKFRKTLSKLWKSDNVYLAWKESPSHLEVSLKENETKFRGHS
jgi:hypothetical protein